MSKLTSATIVLIVMTGITALADADLIGEADGWGWTSGIAFAIWVFALATSKE